ncbi:hypothetical protein FOQG_19495 [Fusarium oxysporum f. sp. raphani 54005]|uniref:Uncharacterized protein n=1 Tax=Fusarium oxysporum f. sp. raphani 54005 TaxID=1089458 RepID=X0B0X1_FUSOX|nr:hypothetical protein FOQG_19495 [Fusarium oxysporum f. sp. raphani 54005]
MGWTASPDGQFFVPFLQDLHASYTGHKRSASRPCISRFKHHILPKGSILRSSRMVPDRAMRSGQKAEWRIYSR